MLRKDTRDYGIEFSYSIQSFAAPLMFSMTQTRKKLAETMSSMRFILLTILCVTQTVFAHEHRANIQFGEEDSGREISGHFHGGWESRYFSEGRDALDGDSLWVSSLELGWENFTSGVWYGRSPDQDYDELQLSLGVSQSIGDVEFYAAFTHLRTPFDGLDDNEIGAGFSWTGLPNGIEFTGDAYYSLDAEGSFWEFAMSRAFVVSDELTLNASGIFGLNQGYVSDGHDGANHFAIAMGSEYAISESISITLHIVHSWALDRDVSLPGDSQLIDFSHASLGMQFSF